MESQSNHIGLPPREPPVRGKKSSKLILPLLNKNSSTNNAALAAEHLRL